MRSGVIRVLLVLLIRKEGNGAAEDEFRPTPIPLNEWHEVRGWRGQRAGTLHEVLHAAPAHYWEDALRHSVYLTLVRDKIDQLIAKGDYVDQPTNDLDDRDLWDKVKRAPFERTSDESPGTFGDVVMMAKGKLMEEKGGFRFTEDDKFKDKCAHDKCMEGVKALWSVKRIRQRDSDVSGRYHYELTFSVVTQKKHKKPHEKPARTFTVRESTPERILETPHENRYYEPTQAPVPIPMPVQPPRAERGVWLHKNIFPNQARQHSNGLDRLFSSLFSDDDDVEVSPPRYKPKQYYPPPPVYQQYSKAGYVGSPSEQQQKKLVPHSPKPHHMYKYNQYGRPIPPPPPPHFHHHYLDIEQIGVVSAPYQDHRHGPPLKPGKTPRPPVLPTTPNPVLPQKNFTIETTTPLKPNQSEEITQKPESVHPPKPYNKHKPTTVKISYVTDHVRPPVYSAPPGVFVTMDKKPFKPMPPLRLVHSSKLHKTPRPTDFRPSPQVLDTTLFSEPDPLFDTAFRPITVNYANNNTTEKAVVAASDNHFRKSNTTVKKPPKKNEIVKAQRVTTTAPEIITAHSVDADSDEDWTNVLGAFAKTTPMAAEKEKTKTTGTTTPLTTSTVTTTTTTTPAPITTIRKRTTTTTEAPSTSPKPTKRTRPPPKFKKPEKVKKHKRVTTTTTTTETPHKRRNEDLTPQASSATATAKLSTSTTTSTTTTTTTTTTPQPTTTPVQTTPTTIEATTTTTTPMPQSSKPETEPPKPKSRYRQSTLKYRSTSGNDKKEEKARTVLPPTGIIPPRRKGSKYQNYISSTPKFSDMQFDDEGREDHVVSPYKSKSISTTELSVTPTQAASTSTTTPAYEEVADHVYINSETPEYGMSQEDDFDENSDENGEEEQESRETSQYLPSTSALVTPNETTNEIVEIEDEPLEITADVVVTTTVAAPKNKTKCKKKKVQNLTNTTEETKTEEMKPEATKPEVTKPEVTKPEVTKPEESKLEVTKPEESELRVAGLVTTSRTITTTTEPSSTRDIFEEIFGGFTFDDSTTESKNESTIDTKLDEQESTNQEQYIKAEDDFADFFEAFDNKHKKEHQDGNFDDEYEYDDKEPLLDDDEFQFPIDEDRRSTRDSKHEEETYDDYPERPYSLLELMAME